MTWFDDLSRYSYFSWRGPSAGAPTLNVGWLERGKPYPAGTADVSFVERLRLLVLRAPTNDTRGMHSCEFCPPEENAPWGDAEIRAVGSDGTRFAAPTLIAHYVSAHRYAPPRAFVEAAMRCASLTWEAAEAAGLCLSCGTRLDRFQGWPGPLVLEDGEHAMVEMSCSGCGTEYDRIMPS
jgi:hypothetical protein